ncbi:MAG: PEP-CTERM sorting domain-containing protein [Puniceicoccales bacterium]|nr:PEP-CTERM sorting domain-containing protein [Puniceicoccales bacterium]
MFTANAFLLGAAGARADHAWAVDTVITTGSTVNGIGAIRNNATVIVRQPAGSLMVSGDLHVGWGASNTGHLQVLGGSNVMSTNGTLALNANSGGTAIISGANSRWITTGTLTVGDEGTGTLTVTDGGFVTAPGGLIVGNFNTANSAASVLNIGSAANVATPAAAGTLNTSSVGGYGTVQINHSGTTHLTSDGTDTGNAIALTGALNIVQTGGTTVFMGANDYSGTTTVNGGILSVNGNQSGATGAVAVNRGATLGGTGTSGGETIIGSGATLDPGGAGGTLSFTQDVTLQGGAKLVMDILGTGAGEFDVLNFSGTGSLSFLPGSTLELRLASSGLEGEFHLNIITGGVAISVPSGGLILDGAQPGWEFSLDANGVLHHTQQIPEPSTYALFGAIGAVALALARRRRALRVN